MKHKFKAFFRTLTLIFAAIITTISSGSAFAKLDLTKLKFFADNNIIYYDPSYCPDSSSYKNSKPSGDQITWVGDSYSVGADAKIKAKLPGVDIHAQGSKHFAMDAEGNPSGLSILKDMKKDNGAIRKYVVFALGTNDGNLKTSDGKDGIEELESILGSDRTIILVTPRTMVKDYADVIKEMKEGAKTYSNIIIADWAEAINEDPSQYFSSDNVHPNDKGYDKWVDVIYNALPGGVGLLEGNGNDEKVWNGLIELNIQGVSDDAAVLAGIMGNFWVETGGSFNPYAGRSCLGLWQVCSSSGYQDDFVKAVNDAVGGNYWGQDNIPQDIVDAAIRAELNYLKDTGSFKNFVKSKDKVDERTPQAYAELFTVIVENCFETASVPGQPLEDAGVKKIAGYTRYQGLAKRRKYAKEYYDKFAGAGTPTTSSPGNDNNTSGTGVQWTDDGWLKAETLPGAVIEDGRNFAGDSAWESPFNTSDKKPNKIVLHSTEGSTTGLAAYNGNPYPPHFTVDPLNKTVHQHFSIQTPSTALKGGDRDGPIQIEIVGICDWYPHDGSCDDPDLSTISSGSYIKRYIYAYSAEAWDYLAVLLAAIAEQTGIPLTGDDFASRTKYTSTEFLNYSGITSHRRAPLPNNHDDPGNIWPLVQAAIERNPSASKFANGGSTFDPCPDTSGNNNYSSNGNLIADKAIGLAWPVGHDKDDKNPTDAYRAARQEVRDVISNTTDFTDCSWFATTVIRTSGVDKNVATGSSGILTYMQNHPDLWEEIPNTGDSSVLRPGDVMVVKAGGNIRYGHVKIYVEIDGEPGEAQASKNSHAPLLTKGVDMNASYNRGPYHIFRFKGSQS